VLKSDLFAYLAAFVTIILAIALTDMLQSVHRLVMARSRVKWDVLTPLLAVFIFLGIVSDFFGLWDDARFERLTFYGLLAFMVAPVILTLAAFAVLPDEVPPDGLDLKHFYMERRRYLALLIVLLTATDVVRAVLYAEMHPNLISFVIGRAVPLTIATSIALAVMSLSRAWKGQLAAVLTLLVVAHLGYAGWSIASV
jgi:hypothetical protein